MVVVLNEGRDKSVLQHHPWIFSQAVRSVDAAAHGDVVAVYSASKELLGHATLSLTSQIRCRMISFGSVDPFTALREAISNAIALRKSMFRPEITNAYRLINGEGDFLSGLIVDRYDDVLVLQTATAGMEKLKPFILEELVRQLNPSWVYEKSQSPSRKEEKLQPCIQTLFGEPRDKILIRENGLNFFSYPTDGQKTGFFLDQRNMRSLVQKFSFKKKVLNCFSYTGAFSVYAASGQAERADSVDISESAVSRVKDAFDINPQVECSHTEYAEDVFSFLKKDTFNYNFVILDPPAFAKKKHDIPHAVKGYKEINKSALERLEKGSFLLTCSCSYHMDEDHFRKILFFAAKDAKKDVKIISKHILAEDHPLNIYHPEADYIKSFLCFVS